MAPYELMQMAEANVAKYNPRPTQEPLNAGIVGLAITGAVLAIFTGAANLDQERVALPLAITCAIGFAGPFFYYRSEQSRYYKLVSEEYLRLVAEQKSRASAQFSSGA